MVPSRQETGKDSEQHQAGSQLALGEHHRRSAAGVDSEDEEVASLLFPSDDDGNDGDGSDDGASEAQGRQHSHNNRGEGSGAPSRKTSSAGAQLSRHGSKGARAAKARFVPEQQAVVNQIRLEKIEESLSKYDKEAKGLTAQQQTIADSISATREQMQDLQRQVEQLDEAMDELLDNTTTADDSLKREVRALQQQQNNLLSQLADLVRAALA